MLPRVYLSYAPADEAFAARLRDDLRAAGANVEVSPPQLDTVDASTSDGMLHINDALARREALVLVLSPDALASARVNRELYLAAGRAEAGAMRDPVLVTARPINSGPLPALWSRFTTLDATQDYSSTLTRLTQVLEGSEDAAPSGFAALQDENGFSLSAIWERFGVQGMIIMVSAVVLMLSFSMTWFNVGIACEDAGCTLGNATIAPGPNGVDGYYLAANKQILVTTGTAPLKSQGVNVNNGYAATNGVFDPHLPPSVSEGTSAIVLQGTLLFTVAPSLSFGFSALNLFLPIAVLLLIMPLVVAVAGLKPTIRKLLVLLPGLAALILLVCYIAAAPEAFHNTEVIHFAPGPGGGAWLAFLFTIIALIAGLSISTKPATQKVA